MKLPLGAFFLFFIITKRCGLRSERLRRRLIALMLCHVTGQICSKQHKMARSKRLEERKNGRSFNEKASVLFLRRVFGSFRGRPRRHRFLVRPPCTAAAPCTAVYFMYRNKTVRKIRQSGEQSQPGKRWRSFVKAVGGFFLCGKALFCPHSRTHAPLKIQTACCCCLIFTCAVFLIRTTLGGEAVLVVGLL